MKKQFIMVAVFTSFLMFSQQGNVGINTTTPATTLDVTGKPSVTNYLDGLQAPRITRAQLTNKTVAYGTNQVGALIFVTDVSGGNNSGTRANIITVGYYYFDGSNWQKISNTAGSGGSTSASNGLTLNGSTMELGGTLTKNTVINQSNFPLTVNSTTTGGAAITNLSIDGVNDRVGIGTTLPTEKLTVFGGNSEFLTHGTYNNGLRIVSGNSGVHFQASDTWDGNDVAYFAFSTTDMPIPFADYSGNTFGISTEKMRIANNGFVGIGTTTPSEKLHVSGGNVLVTGGCFTVGSDLRIKKDIQPFSYGLKTLLELQPVMYKFIPEYDSTGNQTQVGLIAQEVEKVAPFMVEHVKDDQNKDLLTLRYQDISIMTINAIKELKSEIDHLKKENDGLRQMLKEYLQNVQNAKK